MAHRTLPRNDGVEAHPRVHEDEVHLREGKDELEDRIDTSHGLIARRVPGNLEPRPELQTDVDHGAQAKCWGKDRLFFVQEIRYFDIVTVILIFKFITFSLKLERPDMFSV